MVTSAVDDWCRSLAGPAGLSVLAAAAPVLLSVTAPDLGSTPPRAGTPPARSADGADPDTSEILRRARRRQRGFERFRRRRLPWTWGRGGPPCDERIGRFCLRMGDDEPWSPPPEPTEVTEARRRLLAHLDSAVRATPGSGWLADQRIRYLVEAGRLEAALAEARRCRAGPDRCHALRGFVLHRRGEFRRANRAFDRALRAMDDEAACRWMSLDVLYRNGPVDGYRDGSCEARREAAKRIWLLADPLWLVPGNGRRSEHLSRHVRDRMQGGGAASPFGEPWGPDLREILLRYGWPVGFEQAHPGVYDATADRPVVAHYPHWGMRFVPPAGDPGLRGGELEEWTLDPARPRSEYAPAYLREEMGRLEHQMARFRRRDSARVVAAWSWPGSDTLAPRDGLFLYRGPAEPRLGARPGHGERRSCGPGAARVVASVRAPAGPAVVGIEAYVPADSSAARSRYGTQLRTLPATEVALSDLLLLAPRGDTVPAALDRAGRCARSSDRLRPGERLGLYWEVYGVAGGGGLVTELSVTPAGGGILRDVGEFLGLAGDRAPLLKASWRERTREPTAVHRRSLVVRIPADADPGDYELRLRVRGPADSGETEAVRRIRIVSGSPRRPGPASRPGRGSPASAPARPPSG